MKKVIALSAVLGLGALGMACGETPANNTTNKPMNTMPANTPAPVATTNTMMSSNSTTSTTGNSTMSTSSNATKSNSMATNSNMKSNSAAPSSGVNTNKK